MFSGYTSSSAVHTRPKEWSEMIKLQWRKIAVLVVALLGLVLLVALAQKDDKDGENEKSEKERVVTLQELPAAVQATIKKEAGDAVLKKIIEETENGKVIYEAEWKTKDVEVEIEVAADGTVLERETEKQVKLDQVPACVKASILKAAAGNEIKEVEVKAKNGKVVAYGAEWLANGKEVEAKIAPDGKILKQEVGDDDENEQEGEHEDAD